MACSECESGKFGCGCCCASVTGLKGGIHPDTILTVTRDLVLEDLTDPPTTRTFRSEILLGEPSHIVGVNASLVCIRRDTDQADSKKQVLLTGSTGVATVYANNMATVSLFTTPGFSDAGLALGGFNPDADNEEQDRDYLATISLSSHMPTYEISDEIFGYFADGGLFVEFNAPNTMYGVRLIVRYIPRLQFTPAYHDPVEVMQHYWKCSNDEEEFLEGFYGGTALDIPSSNSSGVLSRSPFESEYSTYGSWVGPTSPSWSTWPT